MADFVTAIAAVLAAIFGGVFWHKKQITKAKQSVIKGEEKRAQIVRANVKKATDKIDKKTEAKIRKVTAEHTPPENPTGADANELHKDATEGEW
ncbi:MAG: hypothetical protein CMJ20_02495 [Phycisphaeraceae bacterium]|nr:hypothetical protein [Phycisphaeraceae bacterium]